MADNNKSDASKALKEIYNTVKQLYTLLKVFQIDVNENTELLKKLVNSNSTGNSNGTITYEQMLNYLSKHAMWKLTDKQIYYLVERGDDWKYISAISGYKPEEIKKKYEQHKKNNVYK